MISQLTVFLANTNGRLAAACRTLSDADINMKALFIAATADFGSATGDSAVLVEPGERVPGFADSASGAGSTTEISSDSIVLKDFPLVFIRGPFVAEVGSAATVETSVSGNVVGLRQGKILATAFHPELTDDTRIHELFLSL